MNDNYEEFAVLGEIDEEIIDFDQLESQLESEISEQLSGLEFLETEKEQIANPDALGETIKNVIWEQFTNQIGVNAGEEFIRDNNGMTLDLRSDAHIQTAENFANGKIASHNQKTDYQKRYDDWQSNFVKDENGNIVTHTTRTGQSEATLVKGARKPFDEGRPTGNAQKKTDMDHTVSAAEIIRDPKANAFLSKEKQVEFANSETNLYEMDSSLNRSKGDKSTTDWLDTPNANGQKPKEIFDISDDEDKAMRKKDEEARKEYEKIKDEAEQAAKVEGKKSQREEAFRIGGAALKAVVMQLLAELVREIIAKLVIWLKSKQKSFNSFIDSLKEAIKSFVHKLKSNLINAGNTLLTTIATAIIGPVVGVIKKVFILLKQGVKSVKSAIDFLKDPQNKTLPMSVKALEIGKIVMAGLSGAGAIILSELIEKSLLTIPVFAIEIPLFGSLASIIGIFMGAVVAGIIGAIVINMLDTILANKQKNDIVEEQIDKSNEVLMLQRKLRNVTESKVETQIKKTGESIKSRHQYAAETIGDMLDSIYSENEDTNEEKFQNIDSKLSDLLN